MGKINWMKVTVAGLAAGVLFAIVDVVTGSMLFAAPMEAALKARNLDMAAMEGAVPIFIVTDLLYGMLVAFAYAAIRPRFGAGPKTGVIASLSVWAAGTLTALAFSAMGFMPMSLFGMVSAVNLVTALAAGYIASMLYTE